MHPTQKGIDAGTSAKIAAEKQAAAERWLVEAGTLSGLDLVVAPHHGSRSSSSAALVAALAPRVVVFPVGYRSRFGHPHPEVWARWAAAGARGYRTDSQGAVRARIDPAGLTMRTERGQRARYWHGR